MKDVSLNQVRANVESMADLQAQSRLHGDDRLRGPVERLFGMLTLPLALYVMVTLMLIWAGLNLSMGKRAWDPAPFLYLQGLVGVLSLLTSVSVLIVQEREARIARTRAELDLQINLLAEQKVAKLIGLVEELRRDLPGVRDRQDPQAEVMQRKTDPAAVLEAIVAQQHDGGETRDEA